MVQDLVYKIPTRKKKSERGEMIELLIIHEIVWVNFGFFISTLEPKNCVAYWTVIMKAALNFFFFWKGKRGFTQIEIEY